MNNFNTNAHPTSHAQLGIKGRLMRGFAIVTLIFVIMVSTTLVLIWSAKQDASFFYNHAMAVTHEIEDLQARVVGLETHLSLLLIANDTTIRNGLDQNISDIEKMVSNISTNIAKLNDNAASSDWSVLSKNATLYLEKVKQVLKIYDQSSPDKAIELYRLELLPSTIALNDNFNIERASNANNHGLLDTMDNSLRTIMGHVVKQLNIIGLVSILLLFTGIILSYFIAMITAKSIINPIAYAIEIARRVSSGERNIDIVVNRTDETGQLLNALVTMRDSIKDNEETIKTTSEENRRLYDSIVKSANMFSQHSSRVASGDLTSRLDLKQEGIDQEIMNKLGTDLNLMTDNLSGVTNDIMQACSSMVSTLDEVRHAVDAQSSGASEQASSINEITASITEIERSATQTMNKAKELGGVAEKTRQSGQLGLESIETSVLGMKTVKEKVQIIAQTILDLSRQTQQVGEITAVVNNLAQQSKMLALNASIEAAKAGDAGKGFAVVASEVKNLAEQSEQSTSQVQKILEDIKVATEKAVMVTEEGTKGVDNGLQMIERTGEIIRDLNEVIREATIASQQIEAAVRQESAGIEQITAGMNEINTVTSSFVESVSQTSVAMDDLSNVTKKLKSSVDTYKI